jgi:hypothetical protein
MNSRHARRELSIDQQAALFGLQRRALVGRRAGGGRRHGQDTGHS